MWGTWKWRAAFWRECGCEKGRDEGENCKASCDGHVEVVKTLLAAEADVDRA